MIDHQCLANGYYTSGSGVVVVSARLFTRDGRPEGNVIGTAVHEIRHAWQDYYGMIPDFKHKKFIPDIIRIGLIEADAHAHGELARAEYFHALDREMIEGTLDTSAVTKHNASYIDNLLRHNIERDARELAETQAVLWREFKKWYTGDRAGFYGDAVQKETAVYYGVPNARKPDYKFIFDSQAQLPPCSGIDYTRREDLLRLGKGFNGGNYIAQNGDADWLRCVALNPTRAQWFFAERNWAKRPTSMVRESILREKKVQFADQGAEGFLRRLAQPKAP